MPKFIFAMFSMLALSGFASATDLVSCSGYYVLPDRKQVTEFDLVRGENINDYEVYTFENKVIYARGATEKTGHVQLTVSDKLSGSVTYANGFQSFADLNVWNYGKLDGLNEVYLRCGPVADKE